MSFAVTVCAIQTRKNPAEDRQAGRDADRGQRKSADGNGAGTVETAEHPGRRDIWKNGASAGFNRS